MLSLEGTPVRRGYFWDLGPQAIFSIDGVSVSREFSLAGFSKVSLNYITVFPLFKSAWWIYNLSDIASSELPQIFSQESHDINDRHTYIIYNLTHLDQYVTYIWSDRISWKPKIFLTFWSMPSHSPAYLGKRTEFPPNKRSIILAVQISPSIVKPSGVFVSPTQQ